jgi:hypothetical protein
MYTWHADMNWKSNRLKQLSVQYNKIQNHDQSIIYVRITQNIKTY